MTLVREFHLRYGLPAPAMAPLRPDSELVRFRARLIREEFKEVMEELDVLASTEHPDQVTAHLRALLKELADLRYVLEGTAVSFGLPIDEAFAAVHASNMTKTGTKDSGGKVLKGPDYVAPNMEPFVPDVIDVSSALERALSGICETCGATAHGRCRLEGPGDCPEGCVTPEQW